MARGKRDRGLFLAAFAIIPLASHSFAFQPLLSHRALVVPAKGTTCNVAALNCFDIKPSAATAAAVRWRCAYKNSSASRSSRGRLQMGEYAIKNVSLLERLKMFFNRGQKEPLPVIQRRELADRALKAMWSSPRQVRAAVIYVGRKAGALEALNRAAIYMSILVVVSVGGRRVAMGRLTADRLIAFVGYCFSLNFAVQGVNYTWADIKRGSAAFNRIAALVALETDGQTTTTPSAAAKGDEETNGVGGLEVIPSEEFRGRVDLSRIHFAYPIRPDIKVFSDLSVSFPAGKVTALVGPSGAGKSTIAALISRFYKPTQGEILIDGINIKELDNRWLTQRIALVGQTPALFSGTIASNIAYGVSEASSADAKSLDERIRDAAKLANADSFITEFPEGYQTLVGEGGIQLSGGQRQRIAIARAVMKDASILLLDEATSALDAQSEALVQQALERPISGRTVLVIAHRLSTVVNADKIVVLKDGKAIEEGTHLELIDKGGFYSELMRTQVSSFTMLNE